MWRSIARRHVHAAPLMYLGHLPASIQDSPILRRFAGSPLGPAARRHSPRPPWAKLKLATPAIANVECDAASSPKRSPPPATRRSRPLAGPCRRAASTPRSTAICRPHTATRRRRSVPSRPCSEVARSGGETKAAATEVLEKLLVTLADSRSGPEARGDAIVALATMIRAMTMARIVSDTFLSDEILNRAKDHLHR